MDPNVVGRYYQERLPTGPETQRVVVLDLTDGTEGNATGIGMAEFCTARAASKLDRAKTYMNQLTSKTPQGGRMPMIGGSDRETLQMAISSLRRARHDAIRLVRIHNTKDLEQVWASEALLPELRASGSAEVAGELCAPCFDEAGNLW